MLTTSACLTNPIEGEVGPQGPPGSGERGERGPQGIQGNAGPSGNIVPENVTLSCTSGTVIYYGEEGQECITPDQLLALMDIPEVDITTTDLEPIFIYDLSDETLVNIRSEIVIDLGILINDVRNDLTLLIQDVDGKVITQEIIDEQIALIIDAENLKGETGQRGITGETGAQGEPGEPGGPKGDKGDVGKTGKGERGSTGARGKTGPTGKTGDSGPRGKIGPTAGIAELERIAEFDSSQKLQRTVDAECPEGKQVIGGGFWTDDTSVIILESQPLRGLDGWRVKSVSREDHNYLVRAYAICAESDLDLD